MSGTDAPWTAKRTVVGLLLWLRHIVTACVTAQGITAPSREEASSISVMGSPRAASSTGRSSGRPHRRQEAARPRALPVVCSLSNDHASKLILCRIAHPKEHPAL